MEYLCNNCPRRCNVLRAEAGAGYCRMGADAVVARAALHFDEEPILSGLGGSGTVFFSGCALKCRYCQNREISHESFGRRVTAAELRNIYADLIAQGADNINLVNPTHFVEPILESLSEKLPVPVVWNSGGYERVETIERLRGRVQVYLPDLKYRWPCKAGAYSGAPDYFEHASAAIRAMLDQVGPVRLDDRGLARSGLIVRHLILPGRAAEAMRVLEWIADNLPGAWVSLMAQYVPVGDVEIDALNRRISQREYDAVVSRMFALGLEDGFVQELSSADERYIPDFDLTGIPES